MIEAIELELLKITLSTVCDESYRIPIRTYVGIVEVALVTLELDPVGPAIVEDLAVAVEFVGSLRISDVLDSEDRLVEATEEVFQTGSIDPDGLLIVMMVLIVVEDTVVVEGEALDIVVAFQVGVVPVANEAVGVRVATTVVVPPVTVTMSITF